MLSTLPGVTTEEAAAALVTMAGTTAAAAIGTRRALRRVRALHDYHPSERRARAVEALTLAAAHFERSTAAAAGQPA